jgi:hypothetical protein
VSDLARERTITLRVSDQAYRTVQQALFVRQLVDAGVTAADAVVYKIWDALKEDRPEVFLALKEEGSAVGTKKEL